MELESIKLEAINFWQQTMLDENIQGKLSFSIIEEPLRQVTLRLKATFLGQRKEVIRYPATWWDAVKERWVPPRLKRRFPVRYLERQVLYICPHILAPWPDAPEIHLRWMKEAKQSD